MANFDFLKKQAAKAVNRVSQVAEVAVEKGSEMAEIGKLKMKISGKERQIEDLYYKIGKAVYESCSESGSYPGFVATDCEAVTAYRKEIEDLKGKIEWIKGGNVEEESDDEFAVPEEEVVVTSMEPVTEEEHEEEAEVSDEGEGDLSDDDFSGIEIPVDSTPTSEATDSPSESGESEQKTDETEK